MSTTPSPLSSFSPKSFWKKPEGTPGMILMGLAALAGAVGLYFALPFLITLVSNTIELGILAGVLAAMVYVVMNGTVQALAKNIFQSICRGIARTYTTIDPIGILRNQLDDMKKAKEELDETVQKFAGSYNNLKSNIARKNQQIMDFKAKADAAGRMLQSKTDPLERERIQLEQQTFLQNAGMVMQTQGQLQALADQTKDMLDKFRHWSQISDAKIQRTGFQVELLAEQRTMVLAAKRTLGIGMRLLKGDPEQLKLVDGAIEYLQEDAAQTLGEIEEFNRYSDKLLTDIDIENNANAEVARAKFAEMGSKLEASANRPDVGSAAIQQLQAALAQANSPISIPTTPVTGRGTAAGANTGTTTGTGDYNDLFKR
jgi:hypothetical protein